MSATTIAQALARARQRLGGADNNPHLEAELLLAEALNASRTHLMAWPEKVLDAEPLQRLDRLLARRVAGEPIAYLLGQREFWSLPLHVTPDTLIPRPDTERLVEIALERIPPDRSERIADLGTGSGAIALAVARERPRCQLLASDHSPEALAVARENARNLGIDNVSFHLGDWYRALPPGPLDLILCNPPYVADDDPHLQRGDLRFEPREALASGPQGLDALRSVIANAPQALRPGGSILLEHGFEQGPAVAELLAEQGLQDIQLHRDLAGLLRVSEARRGNSP